MLLTNFSANSKEESTMPRCPWAALERLSERIEAVPYRLMAWI